MIVYQITNKVNGKKYIGVTCKTLKQRWDQHVRHGLRYNSQYKLHRAIRKYGTSGFIVEQIETAIDLPTALIREQVLIAETDSYHTGYNLTFGGDHYIDPNWQRENQLKRVASGNHPFLGGEIQRKSGKRRWKDGTNSLIGMNEKLLAENKHIFQGDRNPCRRLAKLGLHHNQKPAWLNTKANKAVWAIADQIYNKWRSTSWSYRNLQKHFKTTTHLGNIVTKFKSGWIPLVDPVWVEWRYQLTG